MGNKYFLFDLDGTLTDPAIGITNSVMHALEKYNIRVKDRSELYPFIGPPLTDSFRKYFGFTEEQANQAVVYYREYFRDTGIFENKVYDGISEMLAELKKRGCKVALATSKPYEFAVRILKHFQLYDYFDFFGAATMDGRITKKADVIAELLRELGNADKSEMLMIGDRDQDIAGAKANGLRSAGVLWGYGSEEELTGAGADYLAAKPEDLLKLAEER
ncbi:MAG: HAD family hydrolase [Lachnospiraceae bacterium]|nr:HAD family hydrolase [Lachnospiraceae bacterium]